MVNMNRLFLRRGFTLIEVLVVISIIGILSSILYANFSDARIEAKNKALQTSLNEVQLALEVYKSQNSRYPVAANMYWLGVALVPEFIAELPKNTDSVNGAACNITYITDAAGSYYKITAANCHGGATAYDDGGVQADDKFARCASSCAKCAGQDYQDESDPQDYLDTEHFYKSYAVYSFGGECR